MLHFHHTKPALFLFLPTNNSICPNIHVCLSITNKLSTSSPYLQTISRSSQSRSYMQTNEINQEEEQDLQPSSSIINSQDLKSKIRRIIQYQKSLNLSSSTSSSSPFSSLVATSRKASSLIDMLKAGNTSLRRLFEMEHTSLSTYLKVYSCSPLVKPIHLWGSDSDDEEHDDPWLSFRKHGSGFVSRNESFCDDLESSSQNCSFRDGNENSLQPRMLSRKRGFRRLPRIRVWRFRGFRVWVRLKRLKMVICGRHRKCIPRCGGGVIDNL